jgi:hypothetical protein
MNQFEKQLESWTPRRPSPRVGRRLFGAPVTANAATTPFRRTAGWNWLAPMAACALTMLVAVHTASQATVPLANRDSDGSFFTFMLRAATSSSNLATFSLSQMDENMEYNVWRHASHHLPTAPSAELPARLDLFNVIPTNR